MQQSGLENFVEALTTSRHFDMDYYARSTNMSFVSRRDAVLHYILSGEVARPSRTFDPTFYRSANLDLVGLDSPLLMHFIRHGEIEGRAGSFDLDEMQLAGKQIRDPNKETILVVTHDLSRTGAPILALNLIKHLAIRKNIVCVSGRRGELLNDFLDVAMSVVVPNSEYMPIDGNILSVGLVTPLKRQHLISAAVVNSVESSAIATACQLSGLPVVSLVHEFAEYTFPKSKISSIINHSQKVIFSSRMTEKSFVEFDAFGSKVINTAIVPQGKSEVSLSTSERKSHIDDFLNGSALKGRFLVIGCGYVQMRKGVDLFIAAAMFAKEMLGQDKICFAWVGDGYSPDAPGDYSGWLKAQVTRSGLDDIVSFLPSIGGEELERLYHSAGAMLLTSRLDPFPNVAIDAMHAGLPVVCFDKASGVAECIKEFSGLSPLVVPYFDTRAAAECIVRLAEDADFHSAISSQFKSLAASSFEFEPYVDKIIDAVDEAKVIRVQEEVDFRIIRSSEFFSGEGPSWMGRRPVDRGALIREYVRLSASNSFSAEPRPFPGFSPGIYAQHHDLRPYVNPLAHWLCNGRPDGPWKRPLLRYDGEQRPPDLRVALHVHLHYMDALSEIVRRLNCNKTIPDLFITVSSNSAFHETKCALEGYSGRVDVREVKNVGRDIGPLLTALSNDLSDYDLIGHIHGKRSIHIATESGKKDFVQTWREFLFEHLLGGKFPSLDIIAAKFCSDETLGLVFPEDPFICGWGSNLEAADRLARRIGLKRLPQYIEFPVGNMFYARPDALRALMNAGFELDDFPAEPVPRDGTILHAIERITPIVCEKHGYSWIATQIDGVTR